MSPAAMGDAPHVVEKLRAARLALAGGYVLLQLADGTYLVSRWTGSRHCADLREVAASAEMVGAPA